MRESLWIGLMSGTSADAVDAALVRIGPEPRDLALVAFASRPLPESLRARIFDLSSAPALRDWLQLDRALGSLFADAAREVMRQAGVPRAAVEGIASHGQTVAHHPEAEVRGTLQLGSAAVIHAETGVPVVSDFRAADLAAGGQGAPLTPILHALALSDPGESRAVLNLGGFSNVTFLPGTGAVGLVAFDPGPANALLDRGARWFSGGRERFDRDGARAARGCVVHGVLAELLEDPYFALAPPKSTGHERFGEAYFERAIRAVADAGGGPDDAMATLAELTIESIARAAERFSPKPVARWLLYGGGARNPVLRRGLAERLAPACVETTTEHGIPSDALEAMTFALLGWLSARGLPGNVPAATGAEREVVLGSLVPPASFRS